MEDSHSAVERVGKRTIFNVLPRYYHWKSKQDAEIFACKQYGQCQSIKQYSMVVVIYSFLFGISMNITL